VFIFTFAFIWYVPFTDDYLTPTPKDGEERHIVIRDNFARAIASCVLFLLSFSYLKPHIESYEQLSVFMQRIHRVWI